MSVWVQIAVVVGMVLATTVVIVLFQRSLDRPGGREALGATGGDVFGPVAEIFNPGEHRSAQQLKEHEERREAAPAPGPGLDGPVRVRRHADGSVTVRRD